MLRLLLLMCSLPIPHRSKVKMRQISEEDRNELAKAESEGWRIDFPPEVFWNLSPEQEAELDEMERKQTEHYNALIKLMDDRQMHGVCLHCGAEFRGIFVKKCVRCGKKKDYKKSDPIGSLHL